MAVVPEPVFAELNKQISKWLRETVKAIVADMHAKGVRHRDYSSSKTALFLLVRSSLRKKFGAPERASITFPRHLVFVKYGVGKGRAKGSGKETPKDIFDNVLEKRVNELYDIVQNGYADIVVKNLFIDKNRGKGVT